MRSAGRASKTAPWCRSLYQGVHLLLRRWLGPDLQVGRTAPPAAPKYADTGLVHTSVACLASTVIAGYRQPSKPHPSIGGWVRDQQTLDALGLQDSNGEGDVNGPTNPDDCFCPDSLRSLCPEQSLVSGRDCAQNPVRRRSARCKARGARLGRDRTQPRTSRRSRKHSSRF